MEVKLLGLPHKWKINGKAVPYLLLYFCFGKNRRGNDHPNKFGQSQTSKGNENY